ncbi:MAG: AMP-binding protein, partial [Planctomycetes bacterium]|nr:AMP-binding protein [Planctomycetota bacterium]
ERLKDGESGLLIVRSPALMKGYLGQEELTNEVFIHGGYNTGDIVRIDEDGFIFITGRLARFAKIGGEMVPLDNVQEALQNYIDGLDQDSQTQIAVAAVPDPARGERIVVMHTGISCSNEDLINALSDFPPIFKPKSKDIKEVDKIPVLGTGKMDLKAVKTLAEDITLETSSQR